MLENENENENENKNKVEEEERTGIRDCGFGFFCVPGNTVELVSRGR